MTDIDYFKLAKGLARKHEADRLGLTMDEYLEQQKLILGDREDYRADRLAEERSWAPQRPDRD
jgi:hypothetical protein